MDAYSILEPIYQEDIDKFIQYVCLGYGIQSPRYIQRTASDLKFVSIVWLVEMFNSGLGIEITNCVDDDVFETVEICKKSIARNALVLIKSGVFERSGLSFVI
ncbi:hypothetical protein [Wenling hepe-like virus 3]|uniref:hypothetical protein n=1 Tax=Wenling hepe-like virus 3 TaxID=1923495 RepID=UPI00090C6885|nr:hypothetical protein [Wenling hepe-like virus 3]APG77816.1 hypothetical protein [Wenling hepe-like virus 3]